MAEVSAREYDYVIIGGGTAGLVLASRLTEDPAINVAIIEAGEKNFDDPQINIPGLMNTLYGDKKYDWDFHTTPQKYLNNRVLAWPRGRILGGSSAINFLMHTHASRLDLDNWEALGNPGWNFESLQLYYHKSETYNAPSSETAKALQTSTIDPSLHGSKGPIQTSFPEGSGPVDHAWGPTCANIGLGVKQDPRHGATLGGYSLLTEMDRNARRSHAASAYYVPIAGRSNLIVLTNAHANRICFSSSGTSATATGVDYSILELSGIGSREILEKYGVNFIVENLNVGENLQASLDHLLVPFSYEAAEGIPTAEMIQEPGVLEWALREWKEKGAGPLATGVTGTGFMPGIAKQLQLQKELLLNEGEADIQFNYGATGTSPSAGNDISKLFAHTDPGGYVTIVAVITHALSRGSIHIQSIDPKVPPTIDPRYLSHPVDLNLMTDGLLFTHRLATTKPLADILKDNPLGQGKIIQPGYKIPSAEGLTERSAADTVKASSASSFHPVGTCSMLPKDDGGVVDPNLKVYGVENLRIVDASIFPLNVRGNIASLVYAVAERAADLIKEGRKG
ncbi:GMC oxidoreductase [Glonium stellatum]|uniref:GMC oxidoreductase n=1 Tax=Glonium stellatum TaxID=574774 RepID=A0A8E2EY78_9PEZI|nr:GMC oxidoreductase [Glonium stellatum]